MQYKKSWAEGKETEFLFRTLAEKNENYIWVRDATENENKIDKWDQLWLINGYYRKIEIKGQKRNNRGDAQYSDRAVIEIKGIKYSKGWLYGDADIFAFKREYGFYLIDKVMLMDLVYERAKNPDTPVIKFNQVMDDWVVYRRHSQPTERCVYVKHDDLERYSFDRIYYVN